MKSTGLFSIGWKDLGKGIIVAFLTSLITSISQTIDNGGLPTLAQLKAAGLVGASAAIAYLIKNFLTNNNDQLLKKDTP